MTEKKYIELRTNIALMGVVSKAYFSHSQKAKDEGWAPTLKLVGLWDLDKRTDTYVPLDVATDMEKKGFLSVMGPDSAPEYRVLMPNTRISITKGEKGKPTLFAIVGGVVAFEEASQAPQEPPESTKSPEKAVAPGLRDLMAEIETKYAACLAMSAYRHVTLYAIPTINLDQRSVQAGAATMMIEMSRHGVKPTPAMLKALMERLKDASLTATVEDPVEAP